MLHAKFSMVTSVKRAVKEALACSDSGLWILVLKTFILSQISELVHSPTGIICDSLKIGRTSVINALDLVATCDPAERSGPKGDHERRRQLHTWSVSNESE